MNKKIKEHTQTIGEIRLAGLRASAVKDYKIWLKEQIRKEKETTYVNSPRGNDRLSGFREACDRFLSLLEEK
jgi:hypothetical protein